MVESRYNKEVGRRISQVRSKLGMSKRELAKRIGMHESTVKRYEDGEIKQLDIEKICLFAETLNVDPAYLMCWNDNNNQLSLISNPDIFKTLYDDNYVREKEEYYITSSLNDEFLNLFHKLNDEEKQSIINIMKQIIKK